MGELVNKRYTSLLALACGLLILVLNVVLLLQTVHIG